MWILVVLILIMIVSPFVLPISWSIGIIVGGILLIGIVYLQAKIEIREKREKAVENEARFQLDVENRKKQMRKENK